MCRGGTCGGSMRSASKLQVCAGTCKHKGTKMVVMSSSLCKHSTLFEKCCSAWHLQLVGCPKADADQGIGRKRSIRLCMSAMSVALHLFITGCELCTWMNHIGGFCDGGSGCPCCSSTRMTSGGSSGTSIGPQ